MFPFYSHFLREDVTKMIHAVLTWLNYSIRINSRTKKTIFGFQIPQKCFSFFDLSFLSCKDHAQLICTSRTPPPKYLCTTIFKKFEGVWSALGIPYPFKFLKAVFHKFYMVYSWILCPISLPVAQISINVIMIYGFLKLMNHDISNVG